MRHEPDWAHLVVTSVNAIERRMNDGLNGVKVV